MTHSSRYPDTGDDTGRGPDYEPKRGVPRWVKVAGIIMAIVVIAVVVMILVGGGHEGGPSRH